MECYSYKLLSETSDPVFKNVDITIILVMENSKRFKKDPFMLKLSKKTVIQYNKGFKKCIKPQSIKKSNEDINHAYYTAFMYTKSYKNVLILEEDAEVLYYSRHHYDTIDNYIKNNSFETFSFATNGIFTKINENFYKVDVAHGTHAQIISLPCRSYIMSKILSNNFRGEIDTSYFRNNVIVYKYPLIVQTFPETENFKNWGGSCFLNKSGIIITGVDKNKSGWETIYIINKMRGKLTFKVFVILLFIIALFAKFNPY
jgi:hypothetical protein